MSQILHLQLHRDVTECVRIMGLWVLKRDMTYLLEKSKERSISFFSHLWISDNFEKPGYK